MRIKKLSFILENCEVIEIDGKYIGDFGVGKIEERFERTGINSIDLWKKAGEFWVEIHKDANNSDHKPFDRLEECPDICHIEVECVDSEHRDITYKYSVKWVGDNYANKLQETEIGDQGNLYIKIGKKDLNYYFPNGTDYKYWEWINE